MRISSRGINREFFFAHSVPTWYVPTHSVYYLCSSLNFSMPNLVCPYTKRSTGGQHQSQGLFYLFHLRSCACSSSHSSSPFSSGFNLLTSDTIDSIKPSRQDAISYVFSWCLTVFKFGFSILLATVLGAGVIVLCDIFVRSSFPLVGFTVLLIFFGLYPFLKDASVELVCFNLS